MSTHRAHLHDGTEIEVLAQGDGPVVLLPVRSEPFDTATAESMRAWGADPEIGPRLIAGLSQGFRVLAADYEGHRMANPAPETLTADAAAADVLAIADAAGADRFALYGYSWLALAALQVAIRTDRMWALAMGGFPPMDGPYAEMLAVTRAAHAMATAPRPEVEPVAPQPGDWESVPVSASGDQTRQFVTLYESLEGFDDTRAASGLAIPRLCFAGAEDTITYGAAWGNTVVRIGEPLERHRTELVAGGWDVRILPGLDHMSAMASAAVLPILSEWLARVSPAR
jgi:pimeloyl-ACP methyl ester carboxylesterase